MTRDGRILTLLATLGLAGISAARGSRGVVRKARVPVPPSERLINFLGGHEWNYFAGPWTVQWKWEGEGVSGDYDKEDPDDFPLLRAMVLRSDDEDFSASFCTLADARKATAVILGAFSEQLLSEAVDFEKDSFSRKKMGTWTSSTEIKDPKGSPGIVRSGRRATPWPHLAVEITHHGPRQWGLDVYTDAIEVDRRDEVIASWTLRTRREAERLQRAIEAGVVLSDPVVRTDMRGKTYLSVRNAFYRNPTPSELFRLGF